MEKVESSTAKVFRGGRLVAGVISKRREGAERMPRVCEALMFSTALMMCTTASFPTTAAFTAIPALNLPALQAKRIINPTLRELNFLCAKDGGPEATACHPSRRQAMQHGVAMIGGIALTMTSGAEASELKGYKLVDIFRECKDLGVVRFLSVNPNGAVLEALGKLDYALVPFEIPMGKSKGQYVRIAGPNDSEHLVANFECSINLDNVCCVSCLIV